MADTESNQPSETIDISSDSESDFYSYDPDAATPPTGSSEPSESERRQDRRKRHEKIQRKIDGRDEAAEPAPVTDTTEIEKNETEAQFLETRGRKKRRPVDEDMLVSLSFRWIHEDQMMLRKEIEDLKEKIVQLSEAARPLFNPHDIGFYRKNFQYTAGCPIGHWTDKDGRRLYDNIEFFIEAVINAAQKIPEEVLRDNLQRCLLGDVHTWYSSILTADQREELTKGDGISNWITLLRKRWGMSIEGAFTKLASLEITDEDVENNQRFATNFVLHAVQIARRIGMQTIFLQLTLAYTRLKPEMQAKVKPPTEGESVEEFIERLSVLKMVEA